jgi:ribosomal protein S18 acetylase RimI-like enzyme
MTAAGMTLVPMTAEMVPAVAKVHRVAFAGYMNARIGSAYVRTFMNWFLQVDQAIALVAIDSDGQVIGYVVGVSQGCARSMNRDLFWAAAAGMIVRPWLFFRAQFRTIIMNRLRLILGRSPAGRAEPELPEPTMLLAAIGVSPSARGKKVGQGLMQAFEVKARQLQMRSLALSVYSENVVARRLYENCGWQPFISPMGRNMAMRYFRVLTEKPDQCEAGP